MNAAADSLGILIISHGSPRADANRGFVELVERIASRLEGAVVLPAFFSIVHPDIPDQVAELASRGLRKIVLMPYFLYSGQHVIVDIPALLAECRSRFPHLELEMLPTLENDPALEDVVVERLAPLTGSHGPLPKEGAAIERRSHAIIDRQLRDWVPADPASGRSSAAWYTQPPTFPSRARCGFTRRPSIAAVPLWRRASRFCATCECSRRD